MAQTHMLNPYAAPPDTVDSTPVYVLPANPAYAAPPITDNDGWHDSPTKAYTGRLLEQPGDTPDPQRLQHMVTQTDYVTGDPVEYYRQRNLDIERRYSVEWRDSDGWEEQKGGSGHKVTKSPYAVAQDEPRPTMKLAPTTFVATRPFDQWIARRNNGLHFSMASNLRNYPVYGQRAWQPFRNTWRVDPTPWDAGQADIPSGVAGNQSNGRLRGIEVPPAPAAINRTWRL